MLSAARRAILTALFATGIGEALGYPGTRGRPFSPSPQRHQSPVLAPFLASTTEMFRLFDLKPERLGAGPGTNRGCDDEVVGALR